MADANLLQTVTGLTHWTLEQRRLVREWTFADFAAAMRFVNEVAAMAEAANHHPDIEIHYNIVRLSLITHASNSITERDVRFAARLDA